MSYWLAAPLALPQRTRQLLFCPSHLDRGAAWALSRRMEIYKEGDPYTLSAQEWDMLRLISVKDFDPPKWMRITPPRTRRGRASMANARMSWTSWSRFLPTWDISPRFSIIHLACMDTSSRGFADEDANHAWLLVARREGERWRIYPRSLRARTTRTPGSTLIRPASMQRLAPLWEAAFDALPAYATTHAQKHAGAPYLAGSIPQDTTSARDLTEHHPFWVHARHALCAAFSWSGMAPHMPEEGLRPYDTFHWSVQGPSLYTSSTPLHAHSPLPLSVRNLHIDGWALFDDKRRPMSPDEKEAISRIGSAIGDVLTQMAPDTPHFFEGIHIANSYTSGSRFEFRDGSYFMPWIKPPMFEGAGSRHHALHHLSKLPKAWSQALIEALAKHQARA